MKDHSLWVSWQQWGKGKNQHSRIDQKLHFSTFLLTTRIVPRYPHLKVSTCPGPPYSEGVLVSSHSLFPTAGATSTSSLTPIKEDTRVRVENSGKSPCFTPSLISVWSPSSRTLVSNLVWRGGFLEQLPMKRSNQFWEGIVKPLTLTFLSDVSLPGSKLVLVQILLPASFPPPYKLECRLRTLLPSMGAEFTSCSWDLRSSFGVKIEPASSLVGVRSI